MALVTAFGNFKRVTILFFKSENEKFMVKILSASQVPI